MDRQPGPDPHRLPRDIDGDHRIERSAPALDLPPIRVLDLPPGGIDLLPKVTGPAE
jgi:hypothetical protein